MYAVCITLLLCTLLFMEWLYGHIRNPYQTDKAVFLMLLLIYVLLVVYRPQSTPDLGGYTGAYAAAGSSGFFFSWEEIRSFGFFSKSIRTVHMEYGFLILYTLFAKAGFSFYQASFVIDLLELAGIFYFGTKILKKLRLPVPGRFFFLFNIIIFYGLFYQFIAVRQGIAMVLGIACVWYALENRWITAAVLLYVSTTMHSAGLFNLIPLVCIRITKNFGIRKYLSAWFIFFLIIITGTENRMYYFTDRLAGILTTFSSAYSGYNESYHASPGVVTVRVVYMLITFLLSIVVLKNEGYYRFLNVIYLAVCVMVFLGSWRIMQRLYDILFVYNCFLIYPAITEKKYNLGIRRVKWLYPAVLLTLCFAKAMYNFFTLGYAGL